jgi:hypothetical protein
MKQFMVTFVFAAAAVILLNSVSQAAQNVSVYAAQGKACDARDTNADGIAGNDVMGNTTQLMTRNATFPDAKKSWLQFDLTSVYAADSSIKGNITNAKLTFYGAKEELTSAKSYAVHGLNNAAGLEGWIASALTWNTGPGNNIASGSALDTAKTTSLYSATIPTPVLDVMSETPTANRAALTSFLNTDTDGKITFVFTFGGTTYLWNAGVAGKEPVLTLTYLLGNNLEKTHYPSPADDTVVETSLASLSWTNPDPNGPTGVISCDVYFGQEPNLLTMDKKLNLGPGVSSIAINRTNFPTYGTLENQKMYYWRVDAHDTTDPNVVTGQMWSFYTNNNQAPVVTISPDQVIWLGKSGTPGQEVAALSATAVDDGVPTPPGAMTYTWTQVANGAPTVSIVPNPGNALNASVTFTATGVYLFQFKADDSNMQSTATVKVVVGTNSCHASYLNGKNYNSKDFNEDCIVDLTDFADFAADWMICTDVPANCP